MKNLKKQSGITLVALIITIIVLLLLATISIRLALNSGILNGAESSSIAVDVAGTYEEIQSKLVSEYEIYTVNDIYTVAKEVTGNDAYENSDGILVVDSEKGNEVDLSDLIATADTSYYLAGSNEDDDENVTNGASTITSDNYGDYIKYPIDLDDDGDYTKDWRIFYNDGTYVYIIASDYLLNSKIPSAAGMTNTGTYRAYWKKTSTWGNANCNTFGATDLTNAQSRFMYTYMSVVYVEYYNYKAAATLLDTMIWSDFVYTPYADYAIGSPTIEMWAESWNSDDSNTKIYYIADSNGYYVTEKLSVSTDVVYLDTDNTLYFPVAKSDRCELYFWI